jgi:glycine/D-amino acid oxidase-like deaminating enzyme
VDGDGAPSFWWQQADRVDRSALPGPTDADVCVVGAGYTGLWTAYYLARAAPELRVIVLEQRFAGYGASGRNGGWLTNSITGGRDRYVRTHGADATHALQVALNDTVDEVLRVVEAEGIDAGVARGGELTVATNAAQWARLQAAVAAEQRWGDTDVELLDAGRAHARVAVPGIRGAAWQPHAARVHPARLVAGLARAAEARGVEIFEDTRVTALRPGGVETSRGSVTARHVVRATEGFTARLPGERRTWLPMNSSMIVTAPLPAGAWADIGWAGREVLGDAAHAYVYAQRTVDDRIALGGRGMPYRFGSRIPDPARRGRIGDCPARGGRLARSAWSTRGGRIGDGDCGATPPGTVLSLHAALRRLFPAAGDVAIERAWSGVLGVPRDWTATVGMDSATGLAWAGGYVGTGVAAANLAGRTLADLLLGRSTALTALPWVDHRVRRWEPEPLRWLGVRGLYAAYRAADRAEHRGRPSTSPLARIADVVSGRH